MTTCFGKSYLFALLSVSFVNVYEFWLVDRILVESPSNFIAGRSKAALLFLFLKVGLFIYLFVVC